MPICKLQAQRSILSFVVPSSELRRIRERFDDPEIREKESLVREIVDQVRLAGDRSLVDLG